MGYRKSQKMNLTQEVVLVKNLNIYACAYSACAKKDLGHYRLVQVKLMSVVNVSPKILHLHMVDRPHAKVAYCATYLFRD